MGAYSVLCWFDAARLRATVAPALLDLANTGQAAGWLADVLTSRIAEALAVERRLPARHRGYRPHSAQLEALRAGLGLSVLGRCELVREDLGVVDRSATLRLVRPGPSGACESVACPQRRLCPLHLTGQTVVRATTFMGLCREVIEATCCTGPRRVLGPRGQWHDLLGWYTAELGLDPYQHADQVAFRHEGDPLVRLLLRLSRRGAAIGWADGGFGEGLLGWLDNAETAVLADRLAAVDLAPLDAPPAPDATDPTYLAELRRMMAVIRDTSAAAAAVGSGLALQRL